MVTDPDRADRRPVLRVLRGNATPEEIAALVAVLLSRPAAEEPPPRPAPSAWADRSRLLGLNDDTDDCSTARYESE